MYVSRWKLTEYRNTNFGTSERASSEWTWWETRKKRESRHEALKYESSEEEKIGKTRFSNKAILIDLIDYEWFATTHTHTQKDFFGEVPTL